MTDPRGIVKLRAGSKTFNLSLPINRICDMEEDFSETRGVDMDCQRIGLSLESAGFRALRKVVFHGLATDWPEDEGELTEKRAGEIMQAAGIEAAAKVVGELWRATFPQPVEKDGVEDGDEGDEGEAAAPAGNRQQRRAGASAAGKAAKK